MAYSSVKKPAFYVPVFDYLQSTGMIAYDNDPLNDIHLLNPTKTHRLYLEQRTMSYDITLNSPVVPSQVLDSNGDLYLFILGHNFKTTDCSIELELLTTIEGVDTAIASGSLESIVNYNGSSSKPDYNGFSIIKANYSISTNIDGFKIKINGFSADSDDEIKIGCVSLCKKWNPPHNPDLSLSMTRQYDGVKTTRTKGGATLSNAQYTRGGTFWANNHAWELSGQDYEQAVGVGHSYRNIQRTLGRRIWSMNFSYLAPANVMPEIESLDYYATEYADNLGVTLHENSDSFFANVLNRVQGSHLPFIFQPNDTDNNTNPDQWAIVRFDQKDFTITQAAPDLYSLSMKLTESW